jgi:hypothetical protein
MQETGCTRGEGLSTRQAGRAGVARAWRLVRVLTLVILLAGACVLWVVACSPDEDGVVDGEDTTSTDEGAIESGDIQGGIDEAIKVGDAVVTVRAFQATFQPAVPEQRLSEQTPTRPGAGETFYQAYVRVQNNEVTPLRVDAEDFVCAVGNSVVTIEPTRSGPFPRSLLKNTSLDLLLTFRAQAGYEPRLIYTPPWYDGVITISPEAEETSTTTTT